MAVEKDLGFDSITALLVLDLTILWITSDGFFSHVGCGEWSKDVDETISAICV